MKLTKYCILMTCVAYMACSSALNATDAYVCFEKTIYLKICDSGYDSDSTYTWATADGTGKVSKVEEDECWVKIQGDAPGDATVTVTDENGVGCGSFTVTCVRLVSQTLVTSPAARDRLKLGVHEVATISVLPSTVGTPTWSKISGDSSLSSYGQSASVTLTAHDSAEKAKFKAQFTGFSCEIEYDIVEPSGVVLDNSNTTHSTADATGMYVQFSADVYITPSDVNFVGVSVGENRVSPVTKGYFDGGPTPDHLQNGPELLVSHATQGTKGSVPDNVGGGTHDSNYSAGTFVYSIPWRYNIVTVSDKVFATIDHNKELAYNGTKWELTMSKAGSSASVQAP